MVTELSPDKKYIPLSEAAKISGYSADHLRRLIQKGKMEGWRIGRNFVTTREAVDGYVAQLPRPGPKPKSGKEVT